MRAEMGKDPTRAPQSQLNLPPGFRFYPTDEELVVHYLCKKAACEPFAVPIIAEVELYKYDPWDLPAKALFGEREWYFFSPRDRKYPNGSRPNRAAGAGYWKATGTDKPIGTLGGSKKVGVKKALVFYKGKAPKGVKTNWIMHEYRLAETNTPRSSSAKRKGTLRLDDWVLCRIYKKSSSAANQMKAAFNGFDGVKGEQSESSCLDEVLATLSELDDPTDALCNATEEAHTDMVQFGALEEKSNSLQSSLERLYQESAVSAYSSQGGVFKAYTSNMKADGEVKQQPVYAAEAASVHMWDNASMPVSNGSSRQHSSQGGDFKAYTSNMKADGEGKQQLLYAAEAASVHMWDNAATPESNGSSRQHSSLESHSMSGQQEEEELTVESTFNSLAGLPLTKLLSTSLNTQNLVMGSNPLYGLDLGLPSPCTMLAQGASFGSSLMDPDSYFFQSSHLTSWDPTKVNYSS